jgi:hypothetical protein
MSNSATSAAKRRRAAPFLTGSGLSATFPSETLTSITSPPSIVPQSQSSDQKLLTLPQVIALVDSRLTNLEKNVIEMKSAPITSDSQSVDVTSNINEDSVKTLIDSIMFEHLSEFNERYEILANEISELKNLVIGLQAYTMNVNKVLFEERENLLQPPKFTNASTNVDGLTAEDPLIQTSEETSIPLVESNKDDNQLILEEQPDVTIVAKNQKRKGSNKKSQFSLEQE